ncbi:MAG: BadF/BadG/BcrA/BcrD ATPase family protein [Bacteroidota bacterium]|nr:BadF/BadG/BcrA/BcrD ATPase family protein [Bacteroidota bacterium]MDP4233224.1 BadF/BadG/BcrA/BcrD ATPase family protein [Bacteroidota bacterium]MDP4242157.1 BadF/BadG/BcrA/BcrD ATPase family protein [Bacteroidota bacterium]MDP4287807.1 BadF/BadG/BcrA/BcrD ATPase family protein [Bacteroidota bacterium]
MSSYYLGIDLGSTTSKAVIINQNDEIIGRGITNTRANYEVASEIARLAAVYNARFSLLKRVLHSELEANPELRRYVADLEDAFQYLEFRVRADRLYRQMVSTTTAYFPIDRQPRILAALGNNFEVAIPAIKQEYLHGKLGSKNQFFRDIFFEQYNHRVGKLDPMLFEPLMTVFDKSITPVENEILPMDFAALVHEAMDILKEKYAGFAERILPPGVSFDEELNLLAGNVREVSETIKRHIDRIAAQEIAIANMVGTGYGRALLPFPKECIRSEILCHAFGAHIAFPDTRTVLDIGGQDTKAIQVDDQGFVTSFQMNDRCAAGCGRYLGYIADELGITLSELGETATRATCDATISSTCTVFAGAELRELQNLGVPREDILGGLHKAIVQRAMSLIARSGGVRNEFTFTGGVARNPAVLKYLRGFITENYGADITMNIHTDSIFMGALGGARFARLGVNVELPRAKRSSAPIMPTMEEEIG